MIQVGTNINLEPGRDKEGAFVSINQDGRSVSIKVRWLPEFIETLCLVAAEAERKKYDQSTETRAD